MQGAEPHTRLQSPEVVTALTPSFLILPAHWDLGLLEFRGQVRESYTEMSCPQSKHKAICEHIDLDVPKFV